MRFGIRKILSSCRFFIEVNIDIFAVLILIFVSSLVLFSNLGSGLIWIGDEQVHFQWANHIVDSGDYLTPWAYGQTNLWIVKPPLIIWLMSLSLRLFESTFAIRFWSALFGVFSSVLVFYLGKLLFNKLIGMVSAIILFTFSTFYAIARLGLLDVPLTFFLLGSIYFFIMSEKSDKENQYAILSGIFFGLALMTKQLSALLIPIILFFYLLLTQRSFRFLLKKSFVLLVGIGLIIFIPWVILMTFRFGTEFLQIYFNYGVLQRAITVVEYKSGDILFYFNYLISNENKFWLVLLPFAFALSLPPVIFKKKKKHTLLLVWIVVILGLFSISQTKLGHYIIPVFPAFALILGNLLYELFRRFRTRGLIPLFVLVIVLFTVPLVSTQPQLALLAEKHWDHTVDTEVNSVALLSSFDTFQKIVTGGYCSNESGNFADLNIWNFTGQKFELLASNHLEINTIIDSLVVGDVNGDNQPEIIGVGTRDDKLQKFAQMSVWNSNTLALENKTEWYWANDTTTNAVALGIFDKEYQFDIVTAGTYYNGSCTLAQLCIWNGKDLSLKNTTSWATIGNTTINSIAVGDIDADGLDDIITGGYYLDGDREVAQITVWNSTLDLKMATWEYYGVTALWNVNVRINSIAIGDVDGDGAVEIVAGGFCHQNETRIAYLTIWNGKDLSYKKSASWNWYNSSRINSIVINDCDGDGSAEIITGGIFSNGTYNYAQICLLNGDSLSLKTSTNWCWFEGTQVNVVATVNNMSNRNIPILVGGSYSNSTNKIAQLVAIDFQK